MAALKTRDLMTATLALCMSATPASQQSSVPKAPAGPRCSFTGALTRISALPEGSGLAASRTMPGQFWSHNDSGRPVLVRLDDTGSVLGRLTLDGARVADWEAIAVGPCGGGSCVYVGDIGDNDGRRRDVTIYRVPESESAMSGAAAESMRGVYPDRPQDAEALIVTPEGRMFIVTKGRTSAPAVYRFPEMFRTGSTVRLERVGQPLGSKPVADRDRITDGDMSDDGEWIVLRTHSTLMFYRASELLAGNWREVSRVDLGSLKEPQGEAVAFGPNDRVYVVGEGGGGSRPGTFATLTCQLGDRPS